MSELLELSEAQVDRLRPCFPMPRGKPQVDDWQIPSGIVFNQRHGLMWSEG